jgi:hypothetical protein
LAMSHVVEHRDSAGCLHDAAKAAEEAAKLWQPARACPQLLAGPFHENGSESNAEHRSMARRDAAGGVSKSAVD